MDKIFKSLQNQGLHQALFCIIILNVLEKEMSSQLSWIEHTPSKRTVKCSNHFGDTIFVNQIRLLIFFYIFKKFDKLLSNFLKWHFHISITNLFHYFFHLFLVPLSFDKIFTRSTFFNFLPYFFFQNFKNFFVIINKVNKRYCIWK